MRSDRICWHWTVSREPRRLYYESIGPYSEVQKCKVQWSGEEHISVIGGIAEVVLDKKRKTILPIGESAGYHASDCLGEMGLRLKRAGRPLSIAARVSRSYGRGT